MKIQKIKKPKDSCIRTNTRSKLSSKHSSELSSKILELSAASQSCFGRVFEKIYVPEAVTIIDFRKETADSFTIRIPFNKKSMPGQFVQLSIPGIGECPISISSYSDEYLDLHIRIVGNMTKAMSKLQKGDVLFVRGPYGTGYSMELFKGKELVLVGGGCGVAPLRSIIQFVQKNRNEYGKVSLFFGYRSPVEMIFKDETMAWRKDFDVFLSFDTNPESVHCAGEICFVTQRLQNQQLTPDNKIVMMCGPPIMMNIAAGILKEKGFKDEQMYISAERLMHCAVGLCGHCMIHGKYTCKAGPVFRLDQITEK